MSECVSSFSAMRWLKAELGVSENIATFNGMRHDPYDHSSTITFGIHLLGDRCQNATPITSSVMKILF